MFDRLKGWLDVTDFWLRLELDALRYIHRKYPRIPEPHRNDVASDAVLGALAVVDRRLGTPALVLGADPQRDLFRFAVTCTRSQVRDRAKSHRRERNRFQVMQQQARHGLTSGNSRRGPHGAMPIGQTAASGPEAAVEVAETYNRIFDIVGARHPEQAGTLAAIREPLRQLGPDVQELARVTALSAAEIRGALRCLREGAYDA
jgi:hypothetical protein